MTKWLQDVESRGKLAFSKDILGSHEEAEKYARKTYSSALEQNCFVAGWNMARWARKP